MIELKDVTNIVNFPSEDYEAVGIILDEIVRDAGEISSIVIAGFNKDGSSFLRSTRLTAKDALWLSEKIRSYALTGSDNLA